MRLFGRRGSAGRVGFEGRWHPDTTAPSIADPSAPTPWHLALAANGDVEAPLEVTRAPGLLVRPGSSPADDERTGHSNLRGSASFTQDDPRGTGGCPVLGDPAAQCLIELDSAQFPGGSDSGIAHLFGDPAALSRGDLSSITYDWDCY